MASYLNRYDGVGKTFKRFLSKTSQRIGWRHPCYYGNIHKPTRTRSSCWWAACKSSESRSDERPGRPPRLRISEPGSCLGLVPLSNVWIKCLMHLKKQKTNKLINQISPTRFHLQTYQTDTWPYYFLRHNLFSFLPCPWKHFLPFWIFADAINTNQNSPFYT